ncbi:MAG: hypothetical protein R3B13_39735 [Polyangiaceae bacterium]
MVRVRDAVRWEERGAGASVRAMSPLARKEKRMLLHFFVDEFSAKAGRDCVGVVGMAACRAAIAR